MPIRHISILDILLALYRGMQNAKVLFLSSLKGEKLRNQSTSYGTNKILYLTTEALSLEAKAVWLPWLPVVAVPMEEVFPPLSQIL